MEKRQAFCLKIESRVPQHALFYHCFFFRQHTFPYLSQAADWQLALHLLREVHASGVESNVISYNASISACEKNGLWQLSLVLLEEAVQSQLEVTAVSFTAAIGACERAVVMQRAKAKVTRS